MYQQGIGRNPSDIQSCVGVERVRAASREAGAELLSPVDLRPEAASPLHLPPSAPLHWAGYQATPTALTVTNSGFTGETPRLSRGPLPAEYVFSQIHFHWGEHDRTGSGHSVNGVRFPLEMHVVHLKKDCVNLKEALQSKDGIVVLVYLFKVGEERNGQLERVSGALPLIRAARACARLRPLPLAELVPRFRQDYLLYWGTVGSPSGRCHILWMVSRRFLPVSARQLREFRQLYDSQGNSLLSNSSKPHPLGSRTLFLVSASNETAETGYGAACGTRQEDSSDDTSVDIRDAEYKSLCDLEEVINKNCRICPVQKRLQNVTHVNVEYPYRVHEGDTSVEESCVDLSNGTDREWRGVTVKTETEADPSSRRVTNVTNVNVTTCRSRRDRGREEVYMVVSARGSELHLRRTGTVRRHQPSTEQACLMLGPTRSSSAPALNADPPKIHALRTEQMYEECDDQFSHNTDYNRYCREDRRESKNTDKCSHYLLVKEVQNKKKCYKVIGELPKRCERNDSMARNIPKITEKHNIGNDRTLTTEESGAVLKNQMKTEYSEFQQDRLYDEREHRKATHKRVIPNTVPIKPSELVKDEEEKNKPSDNNGASKCPLNRTSNINIASESDPRFKVSLLVRTTVSDHRGSSQKYYVTKISPKDGPIFVTPKSSNSNVENCSGNEGQYYIANPIFERVTTPRLDVPNKSSNYTINEAYKTEYEETKEESHKQFKKEQYLKTSDKEVVKEYQRCKPYHTIRSSSNSNKQLHQSVDNADIDRQGIVIDSGKADPHGQVLQKYSSSKVNETKKHSKLAERINYYYGKNPPDEDVEVVDKIITGNVGTNDSTEVFVRGKQVKIVNPRKSDVSKEVNYNLVTSRHPEPQNHSQPRATVRQHLSLDQQIQGQSQVRQTVEYHDNYKPPKGSELSDRNMTAATHELTTHQAYKSMKHSQSVDRSRHNDNSNGSTHSEIGETDPKSNLPEQRSQTYPDESHRTDTIQEDDYQIEQRFQDSIDEREINEYEETSSSKRFQSATVKKRVEYEGNPMHQPVENNQNKPNDNLPAKQTERPRVSFKNENQFIYRGVEYEETAEEDSLYKSQRIRINKLTPQKRDMMSYENKTPEKTKPSDEPLIVSKCEIPEPHYITRVPKQPLVEFEAYPVDPYEPFQIISESQEISSTMRAHKTFMMFKKINGKAVLNQPSVIEPITMKPNRNKLQVKNNDKCDIENDQMSEQNRLPLSRSQTLPNLLVNAGKVFIEEYDEENITHDKQNQLVMRKQTQGSFPTGVDNKTQSKTKIQPEFDNYQPIVNGENEANNNKPTTVQKKPQAIILRNSNIPGASLRDNEGRVLEEFEYSETSLLSQQKIIRKQKRYMYNAQQPALLEEANPSIENGYSNATSMQTTDPVAAQEEQLLATPSWNLNEKQADALIDQEFYESKINKNKTYKTSKRFEYNQREMNPPWGSKDRPKFVQDISSQNRDNQETDTETDSNEPSPSEAEGKKSSVDLGVVLVRDSPSRNINIIKSDSTFQNGNNANMVIDEEYYENTTNNKSYKSTKRQFQSHQRGDNPVPIRPIPLRAKDQKSEQGGNNDNDYNYEIDDRPNNKSGSYEQSNNQRPENILDLSQELTHPSDCNRVVQDAPSLNRNIKNASTNQNTNIYIDQQYYESSTNKSKSYRSTNRAGLSPQLTDRPGPSYAMPLPPLAQNSHIFLKPSNSYDQDEPVLSSGTVQNETRDDRVSELPESNHKSPSSRGQSFQGNTSDPILVTTTVPSTKKEGDIVIFIRQPYVQKEQVVPKITVDVTNKQRVSPSQMNQQTVQIQELKPKRKNTGKRPVIKSKIEHIYHQSNISDSSSDENMESSLLTESNEEQVVDTTHYNFTLKSQTKVDISKSEKANVRSTAEVRITPALDNSEPTIRLEESCSDVKMTETTSYETSSADACDGQQAYQSPIQIESAAAVTRQYPTLIFHNHWNNNCKALLENNGKTLRASLPYEDGEGEGPCLEGGPLVGRYNFVELHFHWGGKDCCGAEHVIDGHRHALEAHFLYVKEEYKSLETGMQHADGLATVAVKFDVGGPPNEGLGRLIADIGLIREASTGVHVPASALFGWLRPTVRSAAGYFCYKGTLTKDPPCVDSVTWLIFPKPIPFCCQQSSEFRKLKSLTGEELRKNFRTPKPLNNRPVYYVPLA